MKRILTVAILTLAFSLIAQLSPPVVTNSVPDWTLTNRCGNTLVVSWESSGSTNVSGYNLHFGTASGQYTGCIDAGTNLSATVSNLCDGVTNYFAVAPYNSSHIELLYYPEVYYDIPPPQYDIYITVEYDGVLQASGSLSGPWTNIQANFAPKYVTINPTGLCFLSALTKPTIRVTTVRRQ